MIGFRPIVATEIEFYLHGSRGRDLGGYWHAVRAACEEAGIAIHKTEKEKGEEQHEVSLHMARDVGAIIRDTNRLKAILSEVAGKYDMRADFSAKPYDNEPGSGLHVHVHLEDAAGANLYWKEGDEMSGALSASIAGLLATIHENMGVFAPTQESRKRFTPGSNAPTTISWGANNRTCAIRLPDKGTKERHIEHRVAGADADVGAVIDAILKAIEYGLENKLTPPPQIYGDASLEMYKLEKIAV